MVKFITEQTAPKEVFPEPFARTIAHMAAPWTLGTQKIWLGLDEIQPHNRSNGHSHQGQEEVFFFLGGKGVVKVDDDEIEVGPGFCVLCPAGSFHQVINSGDHVLRFVAVVSPSFTPQNFNSSHGQKEQRPQS